MENEKRIDPKKVDFSICKVRFFEQNYWEEGQGSSFLKKKRPSNGFLYLSSCDACLVLPDGREIFAESGNCIYLPKKSRYRLIFSHIKENPSTYLINCHFSFGEKEHVLAKEPVILPHEKKHEIREIFGKIADRKATDAHLKSSIWALIALWSDFERKEERLRRKIPSFLKTALSYIEEHEKEEISVSDLSEMCLVSQSYFRKEFRRFFGQSPQEYILRHRMDAAKRYLEMGDLNVSEVSSVLGFSSPAYFSRIFKEKNGISPKDYMKNSRR